jgi:PadR family transcriptional regulator, regulatory protein AphA
LSSESPRLSPTSFIVLGLIQASGEATPYDLKSAMAAGIRDLWSLQHAQLYSEPARLAGSGYLIERQEQDGRRRKHYKITEKGRQALQRWLQEPPAALAELREPGLLKLFFGADPQVIASTQLKLHEERLAGYETLVENTGDTAPRGPVLAVKVGINHEREWVRFWSRLAESREY